MGGTKIYVAATSVNMATSPPSLTQSTYNGLTTPKTLTTPYYCGAVPTAL